MMSIMRLLAGLLLAAILSACGGGGGSAGATAGGSGTGGGGVATPTPSVALQLVDGSGAATSSISSSQTTFARATVVDASGALVSGVVVTFSGDASLVSFVPASATALTGANGVAQVQVTLAAASAGGAGTLKANATVAGTAAKEGIAGFQVLASGATGSGAVPASIEVFASSSVLSSAPNSTVSFSVVVKDTQNRAMPTQTVTFSASSGNLLGALPLKQTGPAGEPITTVSLSPGSDRSNRDIVLTASAGGVNQSLTMPVAGTALAIAGENSILLGGTATYAVTARDSAGQPIAGAQLSAASSLGNGIAPATVVTDALGSARFVYTAAKSGLDSVTVKGLGTSSVASVAVSAEDFAFSSPASNTAVPIGSPQIVTVRLLSGGAPVAGRAVTFSTTRGVLSPSSAVTDVNGSASTTASSDTSGPASIVARANTAQAVLPITYLATTPVSLVLQANPGAVAPNPSGTATNQSSLQATVRDGTGNPVAGRIVNFTALKDLSNGTISPGSGVTDSNGIVSVQFIPGGLTTANNGVQVQASVQGTSVFGTASLTVSGQALFISIGKGKLIADLSEPVYKKEFSVYVTDANGAPVANKTVVLSVYPDTYEKGVLTLDPTTSKWAKQAALTCTNEDVERNGLLGFGRNLDVNGNGKLDPGLPAVVTPASVTTDSGGFATFFLEYGKNFAWWVNATITARASVAGTESVQTQTYRLDMAATDNDANSDPPNRFSPFGASTTSCTDPN